MLAQFRFGGVRLELPIGSSPQFFELPPRSYFGFSCGLSLDDLNFPLKCFERLSVAVYKTLIEVNPIPRHDKGPILTLHKCGA